MQARYALHRQRADLGETLEVVRRGAGIEVRGIVEGPDRKRQLLAALRDVPHLTADIATVDELRGTAAGGSGAPGPVLRLEAAGGPPVQALLEAHLAGRSPIEDPAERDRAVRAGIATFSRRVLAGSEAVLAHAWALRRLAERYSAEQIRLLDDGPRTLLAAIVRDHLAALRQGTQELHGLLAPLAAPSSPGSARAETGEPDPTTPTSWPSGFPELFEVVVRVDRVTNALFAATTPGPAASGPGVNVDRPAEALAEVVTGLAELTDLVRRLEPRGPALEATAKR